MQRSSIRVSFLGVAFLMLSAGAAWPCSELFLTSGGHYVSARVLNLNVDTNPLLVLSPRGISRKSYFPEAGDTPLEWTARYGSVNVFSFGLDDSDDGLNEMGLSGAMQWLDGTKYPSGQSDRALSYNYILQYFLDNYSTVAEVVADVQTIKVYPVLVELFGGAFPQHFSFHDATGDSAVLEYDGSGVLSVYRPTDIYNGVMTNEPTYPEQIANLNHYKPWTDPPNLPGSMESLDRFVRGSYMLEKMPVPSSQDYAIDCGWAFIQNLTPGPDQTPDTKSLWTCVRDHCNPAFYFRTITEPRIRWVDLAELDFTAGQSMKAQPMEAAGEGDVRGDFLAISTSNEAVVSYKGLSINPTALRSGSAYDYRLHLGKNISQRFDLYVLAETEGGIYTLGNDGVPRKGIYAMYAGLAGATAPIDIEVSSRYVIPPGWTGRRVTFYIAAVEAGKVPPVTRLADLTEQSPYVIMLDIETLTVKPQTY